jgi:UDP-N-acetylglucosamine acyltransferase
VTARIHRTALIEDGARLGDDVEIGAFAVVGPRVRLGDGVRLHSHVVISGDTEIGARTIVHPHAVLGGPAQYRGDNGEGARLVIGVDNLIREHVTINGGSAKGGGLTQVGARGFFMAYSHVAHDCHIGDGVTFANGVALAGHVHVGDGVNIGGLAAVQQFTRIGRNAFVGGISGVPSDVIPFGIVQGARAHLEGLNLIGLKRQNVPRERIHALRAAYRFIFFGEGRLLDRVREVDARWPGKPEVQEVTAFLLEDAGKRGFCIPPANPHARKGDLATQAGDKAGD